MGNFKIFVGNSFHNVKRDILVYTYKGDDIENDEVECSIVKRPPRKPEENLIQFTIPEGGHLLVTLVPNHVKKPGPCWIELPLHANLDFVKRPEQQENYRPSAGKVRLAYEKGPHDWQLKITAPEGLESNGDDTVRVGDNG